MNVDGQAQGVTRATYRIHPDVSLHSLCWEGAADPWFLLVHGLASNAQMWSGVAAHLHDAGKMAVAVDLRGHGRSSKPDDGYDLPAVAEDLAAVIEQTRRGPAVVAGQSWGGNVVLELTRCRPDLVHSAVAIDGGWIHLRDRFEDWESCWAALAPPPSAGRHRSEIESMLRARHPDWPESGVAGALANFEVDEDGTVRPWLSRDRHERVLRGLWDDDPVARWAQLARPVWLVPAWGPGTEAWAGDKRARVEAAAAAGTDIRVAGLVGDHDLHAQQPGAVAEILLRAAGDLASSTGSGS